MPQPAREIEEIPNHCSPPAFANAMPFLLQSHGTIVQALKDNGLSPMK
jgi:hypothetical protein